MDGDIGVEDARKEPVDMFVLVQAEMGSVPVVLDEIGLVPGVSQADAVTGAYDVIARAGAPTIDGLAKVIHEIQTIPGVVRTLTCNIITV